MGRKQGINKAKVGFSIDKEVDKDFNDYCDVNNINKSKLINKIIKSFLETVKN
tara:strand:+ start:5092 stop:5250 length:159 start_codon:yes stop_codon:yes gene_type:complete